MPNAIEIPKPGTRTLEEMKKAEAEYCAELHGPKITAEGHTYSDKIIDDLIEVLERDLERDMTTSDTMFMSMDADDRQKKLFGVNELLRRQNEKHRPASR